MNLDQRRWIILLAGCLSNLCTGSVYAWSVFATPMAEHLSRLTGQVLTSSDLSIVFTVITAFFAIPLICGGAINDKLGPRGVMLAGGLLFGIGTLLAGFATSLPMLAAVYGFLPSLGSGFTYSCTVSSLVKFFPDRRGLVGGISTASLGLSSVVVPPVANVLIQSLGVASTFKVLGLFYLVVICICGLFFRRCPQDYCPAGWTPPAPASDGLPASERTWRQMLRDPIFYVMFALISLGSVFGLMVTSQASPMAQELIEMPVAAATLVVSVLALCNASGRILSGLISDRIGRINTITAVTLLGIIGLFLLYLSGPGAALLFCLGICLVGFCFGSFMGVFPGFTADQFGSRNNSLNYGIMFLGYSVAGFIGPNLMAQVHSATGSYHSAFPAAALLAALGLALTFLYRAMTRTPHRKEVEAHGHGTGL